MKRKRKREGTFDSVCCSSNFYIGAALPCRDLNCFEVYIVPHLKIRTEIRIPISHSFHLPLLKTVFHTRTHAQTQAHTRTLSLTHSYTLTLCYALYASTQEQANTHTHSHIHSYSLSITLTHIHTLYLSLSQSLTFHIYAHKWTNTQTS